MSPARKASLLLCLALVACGDKADTEPADTGASDDTAADDGAGGDGSSGGDDTGDCEEPIAWYADTDGDGFGDPDASVQACEAPEGHVADGTDCDDGDPAVNPDAAEVCDPDQTDEDCDGHADEDDEDTDPSTMQSWVPDADGDGFFDHDSASLVCTPPASGSWTQTPGEHDCDDTEHTVYPGAPELCGDGLVNDCDSDAADVVADCRFEGQLTEADADLHLTPGSNTLYLTSQGAGDFDGDGLSDIVLGSNCAKVSLQQCAGEVYVLHGATTGLSTVDEDVVLQASGELQYFGVAVASLGDLDGDGYEDLAIGAPGVDHGFEHSGAAYVLHGPLSSGLGASMATAFFTGGEEDWAGVGLGAAGDTDGDGVTDLLVGAWNHGGAGVDSAGAVFLMSGALTGHQSLPGSATATVLAEDRYDYFGYWGTQTSLGDVDGDGLDDFALSTGYEDDGGTNAGAAYLFRGPVTGLLTMSDADATVRGDYGNDLAGCRIVGGNDHNGDGLGDLAIGVPGWDTDADDAGAIFVVSGDTSSGYADMIAFVTILSQTGDQALGGWFDVGDADGDDWPDLLVGHGFSESTGSSTHTNPGEGEDSWLFYAPHAGVHEPSGAHVTITSPDEYFGIRLFMAGDRDASGTDDLGFVTFSRDGTRKGELHVFEMPGL